MDRRDKFTVSLLSTAHLVLDSYSSFIFQLLPLMALKLKLTPAQAGWIPPILTISSSLMQPVYGMISDRWLKRSMSVSGPLIAAVFLSSIGVATSVPMLLAIVVLGGIGVGMFHPQSAALVTRAATADGGRHQGMVMSVFSSAGTVGYALGPIIIAAVVSAVGLERSWYTMVWGVAMWLLLVKYCPALERKEKAADAPTLSQALRAAWVPLTLLYFAVVLRSAVSVSVQTFLPFLLRHEGVTETTASLVLGGFLFFGGVGGFFGGALADRFGARRVSLIAMLLATPLLLVALSMHGLQSHLLLMLGGTLLNLPIPVSVVMAQRLVPGGASTVSALMMGFAWGAGALLAPVTGAMSTRFGFAHALMIMAVLPLASAALLWRYPKDVIAAGAASAELPEKALAVGD
jgi:FSR family fosmidomycin resistance protein-like MFS transporter